MISENKLMPDDLIDYAKPCMDAEKALKDTHWAVLENNYEKAMTRAMDAVISARLMYSALRHMKEQLKDK